MNQFGETIFKTLNIYVCNVAVPVIFGFKMFCFTKLKIKYTSSVQMLHIEKIAQKIYWSIRLEDLQFLPVAARDMYCG